MRENMVRSTVVLICAAACLAQTPPKDGPKPPAAVDRALRARIEEFFQYHVTGDFRKAEALVAEDTKDLFYNRNKPRYIRYVGIDHINYNADFTKASAVVLVVSPEMIAGWAGGPPTLPIPSTWKIEDGKWCWYLEPETFLRTPFGNISLNTAKQGAAAAPGLMPPNMFPAGVVPGGVSSPMAGMPSAVPGMPALGTPAAIPGAPAAATAPVSADPAALAAIEGAKQLGMSLAGIPGAVPAEMRDKIKPDKTEIVLIPGKADKVTFENRGFTPLSIMMLGTAAGVTAKVDHPDVKPGESTTITLEASKDGKDGVLRVVVPQTGEVFSIQISVK